jgi:protein arginine kinase
VVEKIIKSPGFWLKKGQFNDIIISSRLRMIRNHAKYNFPINMSKAERDEIEKIAVDFCNASKNLSLINLSDISEIDCRYLRERNYITHNIESKNNGILIYEKNDLFSILVNDREHFKIQVIRSGLELESAYKELDSVDNVLNSLMPYAFSKKYGYISSSIKNVGTGLKISILLHLPVCSLTNNLFELNKKLSEYNVLHSIIDNENKNYGSLYLLSSESIINNELHILEAIDKDVKTVIGYEYGLRDKYLNEHEKNVLDKIWRSYGLLAFSQRMSYSEAIGHLSNLRLGIILAVIKDKTLQQVNDMMVKIQSAHLQKISGNKPFTMISCDEYRAEFLRKQLS